MTEKQGFWAKAKEQGKTNVKLHYLYGGKYSKDQDMNVFISGGKLQYGLHSIPLSDIQSYNLKHEAQAAEHLKTRLTMTRMAVLGPFALATPKHGLKKNISVNKYLTIDCIENNEETTLVFSGENCNRFLTTLKEYLPDLYEKDVASASVEKNSTDPYEEIKKAKELLDMGIISQEEFDKKKKELLGL